MDAEIGFTPFTSKPEAEQIAGRLVVRRIPDLNPTRSESQAALLDTWRFHAFFTTIGATIRRKLINLLTRTHPPPPANVGLMSHPARPSAPTVMARPWVAQSRS